jgi:hypothetical protein
MSSSSSSVRVLGSHDSLGGGRRQGGRRGVAVHLEIERGSRIGEEGGSGRAEERARAFEECRQDPKWVGGGGESRRRQERVDKDGLGQFLLYRTKT